MTALVKIDNASVRFGRVQALHGVSMALQRGECIALVGGNGSGKSTLLRLAHGLVVPSAGAVTIDSAARQAFVFQRPFVLRSTVLTNVALAVWLRGVPWASAKLRAHEALADVGLQALAARQARTLSGGQQQRLTFARALAAQPQVLLLDEPTASLSPQAKREVEALMQQCVERGMTVLFASHNLGQVKRLASRVVCLDAGRVVVDIAKTDFFTTQLPEAAALFIQGETA
jgi:tungstate transport system ATP-binding protein